MKQFGLIGKSLSHSFSEKYFADKFEKESIKYCSYNLFELDEIQKVEKIFDLEDLKGINVTTPYKEQIIPFLSHLDLIAAEIGAVNTVLINGNQRVGYNTDIIGFKKSIRPFLAKEHTRALILGTGGASKAIAIALKQYDINFFYCSSKQSTENNVVHYSDIDEQILATFPLIINCTPLGTFPNVNDMPPIPLDGIGKNHLVFDLVYNPSESRLLKESKMRGALVCNGLNMLKIQAEESWKIWNNLI